MVSDPWAVDSRSLFRPPMPDRPKILHDYSWSPGEGETTIALREWLSELRVNVATNDVVQGMQICWASKAPVQHVRDNGDLAKWLLTRMVVEAVRLRLQARRRADAVSCAFHVYDSFREGAEITTLTVTAEPSRWQEAFQEVLQEVRAISLHGLAEDEADRALHLAGARVEETARLQPEAFIGTLHGHEVAGTSREIVEAAIASARCGHYFARARDFHAALSSATKRVVLSDVNTKARQMLSYLGGHAEPRGTIVVSCPSFLSDERTGKRVPLQPPAVEEIHAALRGVQDLTAEEACERHVPVPASLLGSGVAAGPVPPIERSASAGGIVSALRLANGLNVRILVRPGTSDSPIKGVLRLSAPGGNAAEASLARGGGGSLEAGLKVLASCGAGEWTREQIQMFQQLHSVKPELEACEDAAEVRAEFVPTPSSCQAALEWLHSILREPQMDLEAFAQAQLRMKGEVRAREKSLEDQALHVLKSQMYPYDAWLTDLSTQDVNSLTLGKARSMVQHHFGRLDRLSLEIIATTAAAGSGSAGTAFSGFGGGLSHDEGGSEATLGQSTSENDHSAVEDLCRQIEEAVCQVMGALPPAAAAAGDVPVASAPRPPSMASLGSEVRIHIPDADQRALGLVGGGAPSYWGRGDDTWCEEVSGEGFAWSSKHPLYPAQAMELAAEMLNARLLGRVRDQLSLTYSTQVTLRMHDRIDAGSFVCKVFSTPERVAAATAAAADVMRSPGFLPFREVEAEAAKKSLALRALQNQREPRYWLDKIRPLPSAAQGGAMFADASPAARVAQEQDVLESLTAQDAQTAWKALSGLSDPFIVLATAGPPGVQSFLPAGPVVQRKPKPAPAPPATSGGGVAMDFLD